MSWIFCEKTAVHLTWSRTEAGSAVLFGDYDVMFGNSKTFRFVMTTLATSVAVSAGADEGAEQYDFELDTISVTANKYSQNMVSLSGQAAAR